MEFQKLTNFPYQISIICLDNLNLLLLDFGFITFLLFFEKDIDLLVDNVFESLVRLRCLS